MSFSRSADLLRGARRLHSFSSRTTSRLEAKGGQACKAGELEGR